MYEIMMLLAALSGRDLASYPPTPEDPALLRLAPADCMYYRYWAGRSTPDSKSKNNLERLLADEEAIEPFTLAKQQLLKMLEADDSMSPEERTLMIECATFLLTRPTAMYANVRFKAAQSPPVNAATPDFVPPPLGGAVFDPYYVAPPEGSNIAPPATGTIPPVAAAPPGNVYGAPEAGQPSPYIVPPATAAVPQEGVATPYLAPMPGDQPIAVSEMPQCVNCGPSSGGDPFGDFDLEGAVVVNVGPGVAMLEQAWKLAVSKGDMEEILSKTHVIEGATFYEVPGVLENSIAGLYRGYAILAVGKAAAKNVVLAIDGKKEAPEWMTKLREQAPIDRVATISRIDVEGFVNSAIDQAIKEAKRGSRKQYGLFFAPVMDVYTECLTQPYIGMIKALVRPTGVGNLENVATIGGVDATGRVSRTTYKLDGGPKGIANVLSEQPLREADFADIPEDAKTVFVARLDFRQIGVACDDFRATLDQIMTMAGEDEISADALLSEYGAGLAQYMAIYRVVEAQFGVSFARDVFGPMGERWAWYQYDAGKSVFVIPLREGPRFKMAVDTICRSMKKNGTQVDQWQVGQWLGVSFGEDKRCLCVLDDRCVIAADRNLLARYLQRDANAPSFASRPEIAKMLAAPHPPLLIAYDQSNESFGDLYITARRALSYVNLYTAMMGLPVDMNVIPSRYAIERHLGPSSWTVTRTPDGIVDQSQGTLPLAPCQTLLGMTQLFLGPTIDQATQSMNLQEAVSSAASSMQLPFGVSPFGLTSQSPFGMFGQTPMMTLQPFVEQASGTTYYSPEPSYPAPGVLPAPSLPVPYDPRYAPAPPALPIAPPGAVPPAPGIYAPAAPPVPAPPPVAPAVEPAPATAP